tara:strand:- start:340 stop:534 length:195 start_codon:yes stop_codon:yes gene_type:complete
MMPTTSPPVFDSSAGYLASSAGFAKALSSSSLSSISNTSSAAGFASPPLIIYIGFSPSSSISIT